MPGVQVSTVFFLDRPYCMRLHPPLTRRRCGSGASRARGRVGNPRLQNEARPGCRYEVEDVAAAVQVASDPLKGVVQRSMVLRDQTFERMSFAEWNEAVYPKVQGT